MTPITNSKEEKDLNQAATVSSFPSTYQAPKNTKKLKYLIIGASWAGQTIAKVISAKKGC